MLLPLGLLFALLIAWVVLRLRRRPSPRNGPSASPGPNRDSTRYRTRCASCGNPFDVSTMRGVISRKSEPWKLLCAGCKKEVNVSVVPQNR